MDQLSTFLADPGLRVALYACAISAALCWLISVVARNYSQVDRLWSILPPLYIGWFASTRGFADVRLDVMFALTVVWGGRLTYNFARKGGYRWRDEDYRWAALRERLGPVGFQLFNATFIAPYQNLLLLLIALPAWVATRGTRPFGVIDVLAALLFVAFLAGEIVADNQQWAFYAERTARRARGESGPNFLTEGLFRYSRHPNFFCEQAMWWCVYLFSVGATGVWLNLALVGPVLLTLLFQGSTTFTEGLSRQKYPEYATYQKTTSRLLPLPPRGHDPGS